ncbi:THAP domain-containing protein 1-like [Hydra vulgaris]|uniref:THAP domain-containing protein 1-like n=1 Tax=Hydra vulgaris TaxID=6087 RepID=UPI0032EA0352
MPSCSAYGCTARDRANGITFHRFPSKIKYPELRQKWITALRRKNFTDPRKSAVVCSKHFTEANMDRTSLSCVRVRYGAIPSIFEAFPCYLKKAKPVRKAPKLRTYATSDFTTANVINDDFSNSCTSLPMTVEFQAAITSDETPRKANLNRKLCKAERYLAFSKKKIKLLLQKKRRLAKRNVSLKNVIADLERNNVLEGESLYILQKSAGGV